MALGYTAFLLDMDAQRALRAAHGFGHAGAPITTLRIVDKIKATRDDRREVMPVRVKVVGVHGNDQLKVLLVEVDGDIRRADGGFYSIPLYMPQAGLHIKTIDELAQALLTSVAPERLRNHAAPESLNVRSVFVVGVDKPQAALSQRPQVGRGLAESRFIRAV